MLPSVADLTWLTLTQPCCPTCSGMLEKGTFTLCSSKGNKERIGRLVEMHSNDRTDIDIARTGDIVAIGGLKVHSWELGSGPAALLCAQQQAQHHVRTCHR